MAQRDPRIDLAENLFKAWSSGDADAPGKYLADDAVLFDIVGGEHRGWPAIRAFFAGGLKNSPDLALIPSQYWTSEEGVALAWEMSATVSGGAFGAEARGKKWRSLGMSFLEFRDDKVVREVDYHDSAAVGRSLGIVPPSA